MRPERGAGFPVWGRPLNANTVHLLIVDALRQHGEGGFKTKVPLNHRGGSRKILPRRRCEAGGDPLGSRARRGPRERPAPVRRPADAPGRSEPLGIACHQNFDCDGIDSAALSRPSLLQHQTRGPGTTGSERRVPARRRSATPDVHSPAGNESPAGVNIVAQPHGSTRG